MPTERQQLDRTQLKRMRYAERKLKEAQRQLARTERSISYWSNVIADLKYKRKRAVQSALWPEEDTSQRL
jgi:hypothetical protein